MKKRIAVITGASSGIGLAAVKEFLLNGDRVYGLSRRECPEQGSISIPCDVTDEAAVRAAIERIIEVEGRIDVLVCNAGFGISGAVEFTEMSEAKKQFDVNFFGTAACIRAALPHMREKGRGHIIVTSSVAGSIPIPFQAFYSATKSAINGRVDVAAGDVSDGVSHRYDNKTESQRCQNISTHSAFCAAACNDRGTATEYDQYECTDDLSQILS